MPFAKLNKLCKYVRPKPLCWTKMPCFDFSSSNFNLQAIEHKWSYLKNFPPHFREHQHMNWMDGTYDCLTHFIIAKLGLHKWEEIFLVYVKVLFKTLLHCYVSWYFLLCVFFLKQTFLMLKYAHYCSTLLCPFPYFSFSFSFILLAHFATICHCICFSGFN